MSKKKQKLYWEMTTAELAEATKEYDKEFALFDRPAQDPPPEALAQSERAKRKGGRPKVGEGAARVLVTVERGLLSKADEFARKKGMSRSEMVARGLRMMMASRTNGRKAAG